MSAIKSPTVGDLQVWHNPQIPGPTFRIPVASPAEAKKLIGVLADYDLFQFNNRIKPDYCNASGLERFDADAGEGAPGWCEWEDDDGTSIDEWEPAAA